MKKSYTAAVLLLLMTSGCAIYGELEKDYGRSYNTATSNQIANPEAAANLKPMTGLSGDAADSAVEKYTKSFSNNQGKPASKGMMIPVMTKDVAGVGSDGGK